MNPPEIRAALDTSVVMRLLTGQPLDLDTLARHYMAETERAGAKVFVSNLVVMEAYYACQHHYGMPKQAVLDGLAKLVSLTTFVVHPLLIEILSMPGLESSMPGFLDRLIHAEAITARLPLLTFERTASHLPQTTVLKI
jgi:predicted nucleic-acid-binding protein